MGTGALEALRAQGLAGKIPVVGIDGIKAAVEAVKAGEFVCTVTSDPYWQGGIGLSMGLEASQGKFDPSKEPKLHREFNAKTVKITRDNVDEYIKTQVQSHPQINGPICGAESRARSSTGEDHCGLRKWRRLFNRRRPWPIPLRSRETSAGSTLFQRLVRRRPARRVWAADRTDRPFAYPRLLDPSFFTFRNLVWGLANSAAIPLILAMGSTFIILMGSIDLSVEGVLSVGAMIVALLCANDSNDHDFGWWGPLLAIVACTGLGLRTAWCMSSCAFPPSWRRSASGSWGWA